MNEEIREVVEARIRAKDMVERMSQYMNSMSRGKEFCEEMGREHRTIQQSFTRLCMNWVEYCARDEYQTDLRNQASKTLCKQIVESVDNLALPLI